MPSTNLRSSAGGAASIISLVRSTAPQACLGPLSDLWLQLYYVSTALLYQEFPANFIPRVSDKPCGTQFIFPT